MRTRFVGGFYGQLVSGALWLASAALATWSTPRWAALATTARVWFAEDEAGRGLGFSMADRAQGTVFALFVRPDAERRGAGRTLLAEAEAWLFAQGWTEIWLLTGVDPALRAHHVYRKAG
jgi:GNAT superfamily N-acetyltransferase